MCRVLFVLDDPLDIRDAARLQAISTTEADERAVCLVLHRGDDTGMSHLRLQQHMTHELRAALGEAAEHIAMFVVSGRDGDDVDSCATGWEASRVVDLRGRG